MNVLDPLGSSAAGARSLAPRPASLRGVVVGVFDNTTPNARGLAGPSPGGSMAERRRRTRWAAGLALAVAAAWLPAAAASADSTGPVPATPRPAASTAEAEYNRGLRARAAKDWTAAVAAFRKAVEMRPGFPEAWNELGYALRNQGRYDDSVRAYDEALRQRPHFPEALEYLGEAYVKMGRLDEARRIHERLKPLDAARAKELAEVISKGR